MSKRKRFERSEPDHPLTAKKLQLLLWATELGIATTSQLAEISDMSKAAVYNHLLDLFHMGLLDRTAVSRDALLPANRVHSPTAAFGVSENIHTLSKEGMKALIAAKYIEKDELPELPDYGPTKAYFLAHEVEVRDVRVWLEKVKRFHNHEGVTNFLTGTKAFFGRTRPDAVICYHMGSAHRMYFIEVDRGTERGLGRWQEKAQNYIELFNSGAIEQNTGYADFRLLVIVPDDKRLEELWRIITTQISQTRTKPDTFWLARKTTLEVVDMRKPLWAVGLKTEPQALL